MSAVPPEIWRRAADLFHEALEQPAARREMHLEAGADGDARVLACARDLLRSHETLGETPDSERLSPLSLGEEDEPRRLRAGDRVGAYTIAERLGEGPRGVVYRARTEGAVRDAAIKILRPRVATADVRASLALKSVQLAGLSHPAIAPVRAVGADADVPDAWIASDFVDGRRIDDYCRVHRLPEREVWRLAAVVAEGLQHAHDRGVVHGAVKPSNILVEASGAPRLHDFGPAGEDDARADVRGLGAVVYTALAGRAPDERAPAPLGSIVRALRGDCEAMVHAAMNAGAAGGYESAGAFAGDIRRRLDGKRITARRPGPVGRLLDWARGGAAHGGVR